MQILIVSISAKNIHKSLAPWCLKSYCDSQKPGKYRIDIAEFNVNEPLSEMISGIYKYSPDIIAFSCYIWNIEYVAKTAIMLKNIFQGIKIVLGGPEVSYSEIKDFPYADCIIQGSGEKAFYILLEMLDNGENLPEILTGDYCGFGQLPSPYTDEYFKSLEKSKMASISNQLIYYESSRGCPYSCAYCLSSATEGVQYLSVDKVKNELSFLVHHGAKCIKFVDRTFNANKKRAYEILQFILSLDTDCTFHFEAAADLFDEEILELIRKMPVKRIQFEIGIQTINEEVLNAVSRKTNLISAGNNIKSLIAMNNCHIHLDLIAGLPFETMESFSKAADFCFSLGPHMLQLGFLKILKGSGIENTAKRLGYVYTYYPPYEVLKSNSMSFDDIIELHEMEKLIDKYYNSGMFSSSVSLAVNEIFGSGFKFFREFSKFCLGLIQDYKSTLKNAYTLLLNFLVHYTGNKECRDLGNIVIREKIEHFIKLDCLTYDTKGMLPDGIEYARNKEEEIRLKKEFREKGMEYRNLRVEYFSYDNKKRLFIYDVKDPVSKAYKVIES